MHSDSYIYKFMAVVTVVSSLILSIAYTSLKRTQDVNILVDMQKNVLKSLDIESDTMSSDEIQSKYKERG